MKIWICVIFWFLKIPTDAQAAEATNQIYVPKKTAEKGKTVVLTCLIPPSYDPRQVQWFKDGHPLIPRGRFSVSLEYGNEKILTITKVMEVDEGRYVCKLFGGVEFEIVDLVVKIRPEIISLTIPDEFPPSVGSMVRILCLTRGNPTPTISWKRRSADLASLHDLNVVGQTLKIHSVTKEASGVYVCVASNGDVHDEKEIALNVLFDPEVEVYEEIIIAKENQETTLMCRVTAYPMPDRIFWTKGHSDTEIKDSYRFEVVRDTDQELLSAYRTVITSLKIRAGNLHGDAYDQYWCRAGSAPSGQNFSKRVVIRRPEK